MDEIDKRLEALDAQEIDETLEFPSIAGKG